MGRKLEGSRANLHKQTGKIIAETVRWQREQKVGIFLLFFAHTNKITKSRMVLSFYHFTLIKNITFLKFWKNNNC